MAIPTDGGLSRIMQRMNAIPKAVREAALPAVEKSAEEMAEAMKSLAPVDTGKLRDSITVTPAGETTPPYSEPGGSQTVPENGAMITAGDKDVRYAHLVEYGTKKTPAEPFFWPVVRSYKKRSQRRIRRGITKAVKDNWGQK